MIEYIVVVVEGAIDSTKLKSIIDTSGFQLLVVVEKETAALWEMTTTGDISFVAVKDRTCWVDGTAWPLQLASRNRPDFNRWAIVRKLLSTAAPLRQDDLAPPLAAPTSALRDPVEEKRVSQSRVSGLLQSLPPGSVTKTNHGWVVADFGTLWERYMAKYPGLGSVWTSWHSNRNRATQVADLRKAVGDAAVADGHSRWRTRALEAGPLASPAGLTPATGPEVVVSDFSTTRLPAAHYSRCSPEEATLQLVKPSDPTLFWTAEGWGRVNKCDPLVLAFLLRGADNFEARRALRQWAHRQVWGVDEVDPTPIVFGRDRK